MNSNKVMAISIAILMTTVCLASVSFGQTVDAATFRGSRTITDDSERLIVPEGETYTLHGTKTYTDSITINGTLLITAFDGGSSKGRLTLKAPEVTINGLIDGNGRGHGGGGGGGADQDWCTATAGSGGANGNGGGGGNANRRGGGGGGGGPNGSGGSSAGGGTTGGTGTTASGGTGGYSYGSGGNGGSPYGGGGGGGVGGHDGTYYGCGGGGGGGGTGGSNGNGVNSGAGGGPYGGDAQVPSGNTYGYDGDNGGYASDASNGDFSSNFSVWMGSGGSGGSGSNYVGDYYRYINGGGGGGAGGASLVIDASDWIKVNGGIFLTGAQGAYGGYYSGYSAGTGGGGSGGGLGLRAPDIYISGNIDNRGYNMRSITTANGGSVKIFYHSLDYEKGSYSSHIDTGRYYKQYVNLKPVASLKVQNPTANMNEAVEFTASSSDDPDGRLTAYNFFYGDGFSSGWIGSPTASHAYKVSGDYQATLLVKDENDEVSEVSAPVAIHINHKPLAALRAEPSTGSVHEIYAFNATTSSDIDGTVVEYWFEFGDQNYTGWISSPVAYHIYHEHQVYYAHVLVKDNDGQVSDKSDFERVDVTEEDVGSGGGGGGDDNMKPVAGLEVDDQQTYTNVPLIFDASGSSDGDGQVEEYNFDFGDSTTSGWLDTPVVEHRYAKPGLYTAAVKVKDNDGASSTNAVTVNIEVLQNQPPMPVVLKEPAISGSSVTLEWTQNTDDDFLRYEVHRALYPIFTPASDTLVRYIGERSTTRYVIESLPYPEGHHFRVRVVDAGDMASDSNIVPTPQEEDEGDGGVVISDRTTLAMSSSYRSKGRTYVSDQTTFTLYPPYGAPSPTIYYEIDRGTERTYTEPFTMGSLADGKHTVSYHSTYVNETEDESDTEVHLDATAPTLTVTTPEGGRTISSSSLSMRWTGSDEGSGLSGFDVRLDDNPWIAVGTSTTHTFNDLSEGNHILRVRALDNLGKVAEEQVTIMVDTTPPDLIILQPVDGAHPSKGRIDVVWTGVDWGSGISGYQIRLDTEDLKTVGNETGHSFPSVRSGSHILTVRAIDNAGNTRDVTTIFHIDYKDGSSSQAGAGSDLTSLALILLVIVLLLAVLMQPFITKRVVSRHEDDDDGPARRGRGGAGPGQAQAQPEPQPLQAMEVEAYPPSPPPPPHA